MRPPISIVTVGIMAISLLACKNYGEPQYTTFCTGNGRICIEMLDNWRATPILTTNSFGPFYNHKVNNNDYIFNFSKLEKYAINTINKNAFEVKNYTFGNVYFIRNYNLIQENGFNVILKSNVYIENYGLIYCAEVDKNKIQIHNFNCLNDIRKIYYVNS